MSTGLLVPPFSLRQFHSSYMDFVTRSSLFLSYLTILSPLSDGRRVRRRVYAPEEDGEPKVRIIRPESRRTRLQ